MGNQEWTIQRDRQPFAQDKERRQTNEKTQHRKLKRSARFLTNIYVINSHCSNEHNKGWSIHHTFFMQQQKMCGWIMLWHLQL